MTDPWKSSPIEPLLQVNVPPRRMRHRYWAVPLLVLAALGAGAGAYMAVPKSQTLAQQAIHACEGYATDQLAAPSTAHYVNETATLAGDLWTVHGYVDAQNVAGAQVRTEFLCNVRQDSAEPSGWRSYGVQFAGQ